MQRLFKLLAIAIVAVAGGFHGELATAADYTPRGVVHRVDPYTRTGHPHRVAWYAVPTYNPRYDGNYVGGGTAFHGEPRQIHEGTWGRDFVGLPFRRVWLDYSHGRRAQGGSGAYRTDGPHVRKH